MALHFVPHGEAAHGGDGDNGDGGEVYRSESELFNETRSGGDMNQRHFYVSRGSSCTPFPHCHPSFRRFRCVFSCEVPHWRLSDAGTTTGEDTKRGEDAVRDRRS